MKNETLLLSTNRKLKIYFYIWFLLLVALGIFCFNTVYPFPKLNHSLAVSLQQLLVLCLLGGIPGILVYSRNRMNTLAEISSVQKRLDQYEKYARIRQSVFFILGLFTLFIQIFTAMNGALMLFGVILCLCLFIIPTRGRLESESRVYPEQEPGTVASDAVDSEPEPEEAEPEENL